MKRIYRVAAFASILVPSHAFLATGETLMTDLEAWQTFQVEQLQEEQMDVANQQRETSSELFPEESSSSAGTIDQNRSERTSDYLSVTVGGETIIFSDVRRDTWFAPYVREIAELNIVSGYRDAAGKPLGQFGPGDNVTIEQMAKVLLGAAGLLDTCGKKETINPTALDTWSAPYISCTEQLGWTLYSDGSIDVHRNATRAEVVSTVLQAYKINPQPATGTSFVDVPATMQLAASIEQARADGIVSGYNDADGNTTGLFGPDDAVTRAEFAKMVVLALQVYGKAQN